ncbi:MAG: fatty-acid oxidation protein subunit alpha [Novosphingobium lindaniclasticum]|jgi:3-hydroxyacyl-CoA dehydrogenase/enoyl-CoA hydratase/3-hydroxybutyryl-CoA epimerase|uniref:3-hydroxyacyl-CoA dehydrogenase NAD-binding domain-containing protein n=1 Tax=Novosphingobium lindaniclasticum TaxID=1329895 RepID=UPI00240A04EA|nr:3-hydroxyacyl-CoA dehydrogenase NAD-binding domain-containing protein [Novosphingobium lindaniclasticum]MDF2639469.1 fatty-acid oxidation protein subunit alpha [Novosphingobium lindaniclasticum]
MNDPAWTYLADRDLTLGPVSRVEPGEFTHWRTSRDQDGVFWAVIDQQGSGTNTLSQAVLEEFSRILDLIEQRMPKALVIRSAKRDGFLAGADIAEFRDVDDEAAIRERIAAAHGVVDRLAALTIPTIAIMHGYALGGGLEIALACNQRIAVDGTRFGFPEVQIGLHPGLGGTARFTHLCDPIEAMSFMLTGKSIHDRQAKRMGLVDAVVPERHVEAAIAAAVRGDLDQAHQGLVGRIMDSAPARRLAARQMRAQAEDRAPSRHYPAPYALIDLWEEHGGDLDAMKQAEIASFARLMLTDAAQNLIRVFFLRQKLKDFAGKDAGIAQVHVIGAGAMGGDIAAWCAWKGLRTSLSDVSAEAIGAAVGRAAALYEKIAHGDRLKIRDALDRLIPDTAALGVTSADLVIEAAPEKAELKRKLYADAEPRMKPGAILATNTSSIPLKELREGLERPERLIGIHFFNPVSRLDLVEVVTHDGTDEQVAARARAFVGHIGKLPAAAGSAPGFIVNRVLTPYLAEALTLMDEGVPPEIIDKAATDFGMPVGPLELADQVGLDIGLAVAEMLKRELDWPIPDAPQWLRDKVKAGELGKKTGKGIYVWKDGKAVKGHTAKRAAETSNMDLADRLILPMVNTAVAVLREGVTDDPEVIDAAMIFGTGFAPFRGGPIHYARQRGAGEIVSALNDLARRHGPRFEPDAGWSEGGWFEEDGPIAHETP